MIKCVASIYLIFVKFYGRDDASVVEHVGGVAESRQRPQVAVSRELCQAIRKIVEAGIGRALLFVFGWEHHLRRPRTEVALGQIFEVMMHATSSMR